MKGGGLCVVCMCVCVVCVVCVCTRIPLVFF